MANYNLQPNESIIMKSDRVLYSAGTINAKKVRITCLNCGHRYYPR